MSENRGSEPVRLFDPVETTELLRGWQLHVSRRRNVHEATARRLERANHWVTVPTTVLAAAAGTSAYIAGQADSHGGVYAVIGLVVGLGAAVGSQLRSTLNLGTRAEANRRTASSYKALLRDFELLSPDAEPPTATVEDLKTRIAAVDAEAPVVPQRISAREESRPIVVVTVATELV